MRLAHLRYISYPRTETNIFPKGLNLAALVEQQTSDPRWGAFARSILEQGGPTPRNGNQSDQAHPPIHPTKYTDSLQVGFPAVLPAGPRAEVPGLKWVWTLRGHFGPKILRCVLPLGKETSGSGRAPPGAQPGLPGDCTVGSPPPEPWPSTRLPKYRRRVSGRKQLSAVGHLLPRPSAFS